MPRVNPKGRLLAFLSGGGLGNSPLVLLPFHVKHSIVMSYAQLLVTKVIGGDRAVAGMYPLGYTENT